MNGEVVALKKVDTPRRPNVRRWIPFNVALTLPAQLTIMTVVLIPTLIILWLSITDWQPTQGIPWFKAYVVGLDNFRELLKDQRFTSAVLRTLFVVVVCMAAEFLLAMSLALLFLDDWPWRKLAVSAIILPMMIVPVDAANAFFMLFGDKGPINYVISLIINRPFEFGWLENPHWALLPIMLAEIWQWTPLMFLLILTGLMNLPENQVRAAYVLGASRTRIFFKIMLPLLMPVIIVALLIRGIETFKIFDPVYILTHGGPGSATETISMFMYNGAFAYFRMGYIAAAGLLVLIVVVSICIALARPLKAHHR